MGIRPGICSAGPIQSKQKESGAGDEKTGADGITGPDVVSQPHVRVFQILGRPVEKEKTEGCGAVKGCLDPVNVPPTLSIHVCYGTSSEATNTA